MNMGPDLMRLLGRKRRDDDQWRRGQGVRRAGERCTWVDIYVGNSMVCLSTAFQ
jgi:hypothetical protein